MTGQSSWVTLMRIIVGMLLGLALFLLVTRFVFAAPLQPQRPTPAAPCKPDSFLQHDIAGVYENYHIQVEVFPCGGVVIFWINDWGEHAAVYYSEQRISTGGVFMAGYMPDQELGAYLDSVPYVAFRPAEPGWIQITPFSDRGEKVRDYRLKKVS